jgi:hypothetical protein
MFLDLARCGRRRMGKRASREEEMEEAAAMRRRCPPSPPPARSPDVGVKTLSPPLGV